MGLIRLLENCFEVPVVIRERKGAWLGLEPIDLTRLGAGGQNHKLGINTVLGSRVWDQAARFEVCLGPLSFDQFQSFLPGGHAHRPLTSVVRFYVREELEFSLRLTLKAEEVPDLLLGRDTARLGWTSWLKTRTPCNDPQASITGKT